MTEMTMLALVMAFAAPFVGMIQPAMGVALVFWVAALVTMELGFRRWEAWKQYENDENDDDDDFKDA